MLTYTASLSVLLHRQRRQSVHICYVQTTVCGTGRGQPSLIGRLWCLMKLIRHKDMGIERFVRYKELRLNRKLSQLDFLPCWISDLCVEVISLVKAWRIMRFDVYICPGVYVCVPLAVPFKLIPPPSHLWPCASLLFTTYPVMRETRDQEANWDHKCTRKETFTRRRPESWRMEMVHESKVRIFSESVLVHGHQPA